MSNVVILLHSDWHERFFVNPHSVFVTKEKTEILFDTSQGILLTTFDNTEILSIRPTNQSYDEYYSRMHRDIRDGDYPAPYKIGGPGYKVPEGSGENIYGPTGKRVVEE